MTIGIVGLGNAGQRHARNAMALGHDVVAYDPRAHLVQGVMRTTSLRQLLWLRPTAVIVATPPIDHYETARRCMAEGLDVLVEKPLCDALAKALTLHDHARTHGVRLCTAYQLRCHGTLAAIKEGVYYQQMLHGVVRNADAMSRWPAATYPRDLLLEFSHELDLIAYLFAGQAYVMTYYYDDDAVLLLVKVHAENGPRDLFVLLGGRRRQSSRGLQLWSQQLDWEWAFNQLENDEAYKTELELFLKGEPLSDGLGALRLIEAARRSALSGTWEEA